MAKAQYSGKSPADPQKPGKNNKPYSKINGTGAKTAVAKQRKSYLTAIILLILVVNIVLTILLFNEKRILGMSFADVPWYAWLMIVTSVINASRLRPLCGIGKNGACISTSPPPPPPP
ncbi:MAG: hypothetical protein IPM39_06620 [Chloroflexi bacterium]|nr:hypothetical protein [Chloroflexota bacterium]